MPSRSFRERGRHPVGEPVLMPLSLDFARDYDAASPLHLEAFAQIKLATDWIVDEEILGAFALDSSIEN